MSECQWETERKTERAEEIGVTYRPCGGWGGENWKIKNKCFSDPEALTEIAKRLYVKDLWKQRVEESSEMSHTVRMWLKWNGLQQVP